jgi:hypothetical protein
MTQITTFPTSIRPRLSHGPAGLCFEIVLDELPLYSEAGWRGGYISGKAEISYSDGDWWVSDITVDLDNGKVGKDAQGKLVSLNGEDHPQLYWIILDRIEDDYTDYIQERIRDELADAA